AWIDEVGADLEGLNAQAAPAQELQQPERDGRLAHTRRGSRHDEQARHRAPLELSVAAGAGGEALRAREALAGVERGGAELVLAAEGRRQACTDRLVRRAAVAAHAARR